MAIHIRNLWAHSDFVSMPSFLARWYHIVIATAGCKWRERACKQRISGQRFCHKNGRKVAARNGFIASNFAALIAVLHGLEHTWHTRDLFA